MYKLLRLSLTVIVAIALVAALGYCAPKKPSKVPATKLKARKVTVPKVTAPKLKATKVTAPKMPLYPKVLRVVAGQPFEVAPATGSAMPSITMCAEETEPATFTVRYGKALTGVRVVAGDFVGPGKIGRESVSVRLVRGEDLVSAESMDIGPEAAQLWVDVIAPKGTKPGVYRGNVAFYVQDKLMDAVPIEVNVRALRLIGSSKQYALYTSLGPGEPGESELSPEAYASFLCAVAKMGFRAVSVSAAPSKIGDALNACAGAGLMGGAPVLTFASRVLVPSVEDVRAMESARKAAGIPTLYYFCASNPKDESEVTAALDRSNILHRPGGEVAATVSDDATAQKLLPVLDGVNYRIDMPYVQALINGGKNRTDRWEWYWWDARQSVNENRIDAGIALWRSGLYGCMPFWMPNDSGDRVDNLDSLLCEALREGVDDTRYITTYMKALRELKDKKRENDKYYIASTEAYLSAFMARPLDKLTPADLRAFRGKMAEFSAKLAAML